MATQPGGSVTSRAASESRSGPGGSSAAGGSSSGNVTGAKFRHGLLQLMIHTIDPLHDGISSYTSLCVSCETSLHPIHPSVSIYLSLSCPHLRVIPLSDFLYAYSDGENLSSPAGFNYFVVAGRGTWDPYYYVCILNCQSLFCFLCVEIFGRSRTTLLLLSFDPTPHN